MLKDREGTDKRIIGTAYLPVPSGISEVNSAGWDGTPATPFELLAQNIALTTVQQGIWCWC
jgi:D-ribose pyranose/furanose isomerase RbsD